MPIDFEDASLSYDAAVSRLTQLTSLVQLAAPLLHTPLFTAAFAAAGGATTMSVQDVLDTFTQVGGVADAVATKWNRPETPSYVLYQAHAAALAAAGALEADSQGALGVVNATWCARALRLCISCVIQW